MNIIKAGVLLVGSALAICANAHDRWLLPSHYNVSSDDGEWVMVDVSASNEVFSFDKPLGAEKMRIFGPDGKTVFPGSSYRGHRKSVVDVHLQASGTYRLEMLSGGNYWTSYELNGEEEWLRGVTKSDRKKRLPKGAKNPHTGLYYSSVVSFITLNQPTDNASSSGEGLEYVPVTHPSDIAQGELAELKFVFNGKPKAGVEVGIVREGVRYRNDPEMIELTSDKDGIVTFTPEHAGRYLLTASYEEEVKDHSSADTIGGRVFITFEAVLN